MKQANKYFKHFWLLLLVPCTLAALSLFHNLTHYVEIFVEDPKVVCFVGLFDHSNPEGSSEVHREFEGFGIAT